MRKSARGSLLMLATFTVLPGCGTVANLRSSEDTAAPMKIYGGVVADVESSKNLLTDETGGHGGLSGRALELAIAPYLLLIDLPLSAIADSLTLPIVINAAKSDEIATPHSGGS
jgi:uncharacterized protein YceK